MLEMDNEVRTPGTSDTNIPVSCEQCEEPATFPSLRKLVAHMKHAEEHQPMCRKCNVSFKNYLNFGAHIRLYHILKKENFEFRCEVCGKCYKTKNLLNNHFNIVHKVEENLRCNLCDKPYQNIKKLKIHTLKCLMKCPQFEEFHRKEVLKLKEEESLFTAVALESKNDRMMTKTDKYIAPELVTYHKNEIVKKKMTEESENVSGLNKLIKGEIKTKNSLTEISDDEPGSNQQENCENDDGEDDMVAHGVNRIVEPELNNMKEEDDERKEECNGDKESNNDEDWDLIKLEEDTELENNSNPDDASPIELENNSDSDDHNAIHTELETNSGPDNHDASPNMGKKKISKLRKDITPRPTIVCPVCNAEVKRMNVHMREEHPGVPQSYACKECSKLFFSRRKWYLHTYSCANEPCLCDICSLTFKNAASFKQHKKQFHGNQHGKVKKKYIPKEPKVCPVCAKELVNLNGHMRDIHHDKPDGIFPCSECGKIYVSQKKLNDHCITAHREDPKQCTVCSMMFKNGHALRGHMRNIHEDKTEKTCPICFKTFKTKMKLYGHNRIVHQMIRSVPVKCNPCSVTFKNKTLLKSHQRESPWCQ